MIVVTPASLSLHLLSAEGLAATAVKPVWIWTHILTQWRLSHFPTPAGLLWIFGSDILCDHAIQNERRGRTNSRECENKNP